MAIEQGKPNLSEVMLQAVRGIVGSSEELAAGMRRAIDDGDSSKPQVDEFTAAFSVLGALSKAGEAIVSAAGGIIFQDGRTMSEQNLLAESPLQLPEIITPVSPSEAAPTEEIRPTTFSELFKVRLRSLLSAEVISKRELQSLASGIHNSWRYRVPKQETFTKEEAFSFMEELLLIPTGHFKAKSNGYSRWNTCVGLGVSEAQVDSWSNIIGYDWKARKRVGVQEALAIRGLGLLEKSRPSLQPSVQGVN